jgi:hypothetical protein
MSDLEYLAGRDPYKDQHELQLHDHSMRIRATSVHLERLFQTFCPRRRRAIVCRAFTWLMVYEILGCL